MSFAIVASVGATLAGAAISASAQGDAQDSINASNDKANQLERDRFEYQKEINAPYNQAGVQTLGAITAGLGLAPPVETKEQIRARLSGQSGSGTSGGLSNYNNPIVSTTPINTNKPSQSDNFFSLFRPNNLQDIDKQRQARIALGLDGDNSPEAQQRINAYIGLANSNTNPQQSNADLDAQVEAEYQRQLKASQDAKNGAGFGALNRDFTLKDFYSDPSYQFRMDEANKALSRNYAGSGKFLSGDALKGQTKFNQDYASTEYGNAYSRFTNQQDRNFNKYATVAGIGQTATNAVGQAGQNYASNVGNNITNTGSANASASLYGGRQLNNAVQGGLSQIGTYLNNRVPPINYNTGTYDPNFIGAGTASFGDI